jgi:hypothetical protein
MIFLGIYNFTFMTILFQYTRNANRTKWNDIPLGLASLLLISYVTIYLKSVIIARDNMLFIPQEAHGYYWHYVLLIGFLILSFLVIRSIKSTYGWASKIGKSTLYAFSALALIVISAEVIHISIIYQYEPEVYSSHSFRNAMKSVIPAVWGISALVMMITGMRFKLKPLRVASLALFLITVIKLFLYDLQGNTTGKIVSFIALGAILLGVSFLYQKLKFIIQDDEKVD